MRSTKLQRRSCLLSGMLLLATSVVPPGVHHCHATDNCGVDHSEHQHCEHAAQPVQHEVPHLHINVLGWKLQLPANCPSPDEEQHEIVVNWFCVTTNHTKASNTLISSDAWQLSHLPIAISDVVVNLSSDLLREPPVSFVPLCDSARLERTGVRLI